MSDKKVLMVMGIPSLAFFLLLAYYDITTSQTKEGIVKEKAAKNILVEPLKKPKISRLIQFGNVARDINCYNQIKVGDTIVFKAGRNYKNSVVFDNNFGLFNTSRVKRINGQKIR